MKHILAYDIGTTGVKTCLFAVDKTIELTAAASRGYNLYIMAGGLTEKAASDQGLKAGTPVFGGGALSPVSCQMQADILGRRIETVANPQNVGSVGAAAVAAVGLGLLPSIDRVREMIPANAVCQPDPAAHKAYEKNYRTFKQLYKANKIMFRMINTEVQNG